MDKIPQKTMVEAGGFEPPTPCLQSRCNDENTGSLNQDDRTEAHDGAQPKDAEETQGKERHWTPGPWSMSVNWQCPGELKGALVWNHFETGTNPKIAEVSAVARNSQRECEANARLIAAAPELFEALDAVVQWGNDPNGPLAWEVMDQAKAALAKALGGQP